MVKIIRNINIKQPDAAQKNLTSSISTWMREDTNRFRSGGHPSLLGHCHSAGRQREAEGCLVLLRDFECAGDQIGSWCEPWGPWCSGPGTAFRMAGTISQSSAASLPLFLSPKFISNLYKTQEYSLEKDTDLLEFKNLLIQDLRKYFGLAVNLLSKRYLCTWSSPWLPMIPAPGFRVRKQTKKFIS